MWGSHANSSVVRFVRQLGNSPTTTVLTRMEIMTGILTLPPGQRRQELFASADSIFMRLHLLSFDLDAANATAAINVERKTAGRPISPVDAMIAGIARVHTATLVTRNTRDFIGIDIPLLNPWEL